MTTPASAEATADKVGEECPLVFERIGAVTAAPVDTSHERQQYLVEFDSGRRLLVSRQMLELIEEIDGARDANQLASTLSGRWGHPLNAAQVEAIVLRSLVPLGVVRVTSSAPEPESGGGASKRLFRHRLRVTVLPGPWVAGIAAPLAHLFAWPVAAVGLSAVAVSRLVLYGFHGSQASQARASYSPSEFLYSLGLVILSIVIHELGHAAAVRRFNGTVGGIGVTLYFVYPAMFTDTAGSWKLGRGARIVVDLGGSYFQLLVSVPMAYLYVHNGNIACLLACLSIDALVLFSLNPFFKFDGYWMVSDAIGVPNLDFNALSHVRATLLELFGFKAGRRIVSFSKTSSSILFIYGVCLALFSCLVVYLTVTSGSQWLLGFPRRAEQLIERSRGVTAVQAAAAATSLVQLFFEGAAALGILLFWHGLAKKALALLRPADAGARVVKRTSRAFDL